MTDRRRSSRGSSRRAATLLALVVLATTLVACQNGKVGGKCKAGTVAQDATHVLVCKKGKWSRLISKADGMRELARIQAEEAAKNQPAPTQPPVTEAPTTEVPVTEPPATVPPTTAPVVTTPPTTAPPTTAAPATTSTTTVPTTTSTTTTPPATTTTTTTTTSTTAPPTTTTTSTTTTSTVPATTTTTTVPPTSGDLDTTYGAQGTFAFALPKQGESVIATAASTGGTAYVLFSATSGPELRRITASGDVDGAFAGDGSLSLPFYCTQCNVGVDDQGRAYLSTQQFDGVTTTVKVARYTQAGVLDASYGTNGTASLPIPYVAPFPTMVTGDVVVSPHGLVAVVAGSPATASFLDSTGTFLTTTTTSTCQSLELAFDHADRLLMMTGYCTTSSPTVLGLTRFTATGAIDTSFGASGTAPLPGTNYTYGRNLAVDAANRPYYGVDLAVRRLTTTGAPDPNFGTGGVGTFLTEGNRTYGAWRTMVVTDQGLFILTTDRISPPQNGFAIAKLTTAGQPDLAFGGDGVIVPTQFSAPTNLSFSNSYGTMARTLPSGSGMLVIAETPIEHPALGTILGNGLLKVRTDGTPEPLFGTGGLTTLRNGRLALDLVDTWAGPAGSIYLGFESEILGALVVRITANGALDTSFSGDGMYADPAASELTVDPTGRVVLYRASLPVGTMSFGSGGTVNRSLVRLTTAGVPDTTLDGGDGVLDWAPLTATTGTISCPASLAPLSDGSVVVAYEPNLGSAECSATGFDRAVAGGLQPGWGTGFDTVAGGRRSLNVTAAGDRLLVLAGSSAVPGESTKRIVELGTNGQPVAAFGTGGFIELAAGIAADRVAAAGDGSVITSNLQAGAMSFGPPVADVTLHRFLSNGTMVTTGGFDATGSLVLPMTDDLDVTASHLVGVGGTSSGVVRALNLTGTLDTSFPTPGDDGLAGFSRSADRAQVAVSASRVHVVVVTDDLAVRVLRFRGTVN